MPECHRCGRIQATVELRRTSLGFVCKDNGLWSRCFALTREHREEERRARRARAKDADQVPAQLRLEEVGRECARAHLRRTQATR